MSLRVAVWTLWLLTALFFLRVLGQLLVMAGLAPFLPPQDAWYSGLLPYPLLLPAQCIILAAQLILNRDAAHADRRFSTLGPRASRLLIAISAVYAAAMIVRYALTQTHEIPVGFHLVLAAYLYTLGRLHISKQAAHD